MKTQLASLIVALLLPAIASAKEQNYTLSCSKEADWSRGEKPITKPARPPLLAKVRFTGKESRVADRHPDARGQIITYDNLIVDINGQAMQGGTVQGSTYDSSTVFDNDFRKIGKSQTEWAFSKGISAWTLRHDGKDYICIMKR